MTMKPCAPCPRQRRWLGAADRRSWSLVADVSESSLAPLEFHDGGLEIARRELRPHPRREYELRVRAFPEQEVAEPLLAARADKEVDVRNATRGVRRGGHCLVEFLARELAAVET